MFAINIAKFKILLGMGLASNAMGLGYVDKKKDIKHKCLKAI